MQNFMRGARESAVLPDAVSFHWYPCAGATLSNCTSAEWTSYARVVEEVRGWMRKDLGKVVPLGITEWNFDPGRNDALGGNPTFLEQFTQAALAAMISVRLDFAAQFDTQSFSGYGTLDMFDGGNGDRPKAQFLALQDTIRRYRARAG